MSEGESKSDIVKIITIGIIICFLLFVTNRVVHTIEQDHPNNSPDNDIVESVDRDDSSDLEIQYDTAYFRGLDGSVGNRPMPRISITSKVDSAEIGNIIVNRGNCEVFGGLIGKTRMLAYGQTHEAWVYNCSKILSVQLDYNGQSETYELH